MSDVLMHPPADRRCQIYFTTGPETRDLTRCQNEGTHWEKWSGCGCNDPDPETCESDFFSWECSSSHNPDVVPEADAC